MSAVAYKLTHPQSASDQLLRQFPDTTEGAPGPTRPLLRLVTSDRLQRRQPAAVYRRRRLAVVASVVLMAVAVGAWGPGTLGWTWHRMAGEGASAAVASATPAATASSWTVRPDDTLWSIAKQIQPTGDFRPVLERLISRYGDRPLEVGEVLQVG